MSYTMMTRSMSRIAELEARIAELEKENAKLKKENESLQKEDDKRFLNKYLVPDFFLKEHFISYMDMGEEWSDDKWDEFKEFVTKWALTGEMNEIIVELMKNFISEKEDEEDTDEDTDDEDE